MAVSDELLRFVREALGRGLTRPQVEEALRQAGWSREQVGGALAAFAAVEFPIPVPRPRPLLSAREAFLYLLLFSTLYLVSYQLGSLIFRFIERAFPDPVVWTSEVALRASIRFSVAALVVALPVFLFLATLTNRAVRTSPSSSIVCWAGS